MHKKLNERIRELRQDRIWLDSDDVALAFKPLKMGLRTALLKESWTDF
jgi:hypothetical protein